MIKLSELKKSLAECHLTSDDKKTKFLLEVNNPRYFLDRVVEAIGECKDGVDVLENTKLIIQLVNIFRVMYSQHNPVDDVLERHELPSAAQYV